MDYMDDFRKNLGGKDVVTFIVVPSFAAHYVSSEILSSLIYRRPGICPVQWIDSRLLTFPEGTFANPGRIEKFNLLEQKRIYAKLLGSGESNDMPDPAKPIDFRAILLISGTLQSDIFRLFSQKIPVSSNNEMRDFLIFETEVYYSYRHVSFSEALHKLYREFFAYDKRTNKQAAIFGESEFSSESEWNKFCVHAFEQIGHIAHLNLPHDLSNNNSPVISELKFLLGGVVLDHHPQIALVINKIKKIESEYREIDLEVLAARAPVGFQPRFTSFRFKCLSSEGNLVVPQVTNIPPENPNFALSPEIANQPLIITGEIYIRDDFPTDSEIYLVKKIKHNDCRFSFSYLSCFFNKRLEEEHRKIKRMMSIKSLSSDVVFDVFAGVGPISIPVAVERSKKAKIAGEKMGVVHANDLNPACFRSLRRNIVLNSIEPRSSFTGDLTEAELYAESTKESYIRVWNMDGVDFICSALKNWTQKCKDFIEKPFCHFIMNLPGSAVEDFLFPFANYLPYSQKGPNSETFSRGNGIIVHVYTFLEKSTDKDNPKAVQKVYESLVRSNKSQTISLQAFTDNHLIGAPQTVRYVSPRRQMIRVTFALSPETATAFNFHCKS